MADLDISDPLNWKRQCIILGVSGLPLIEAAEESTREAFGPRQVFRILRGQELSL
jgi:hypothetical protein